MVVVSLADELNLWDIKVSVEPFIDTDTIDMVIFITAIEPCDFTRCVVSGFAPQRLYCVSCTNGYIYRRGVGG